MHQDLQTVWAAVNANLPSAHTSQALLPVVPAKRPVGQESHTAAPGWLENVPTGQGSHCSERSFVVNLPASHATHAVLASTDALYVPGPHLTVSLCPMLRARASERMNECVHVFVHECLHVF